MRNGGFIGVRERSLLAAVCLLAACGGSGDGGTPPPDAMGGGGGGGTPDAATQPACSPQNDTCGGETICIVDACQPAFGRTYRLSIPQLTVAAQNADGEAWDAFGGAPDPFAIVYLNGSAVLQTAEAADIFSTSFSESADIVIPAGAQVVVEVWDSDVSDNDWVTGCAADPLTADFLRGGGFQCSDQGTTVTVALDRK